MAAGLAVMLAIYAIYLELTPWLKRAKERWEMVERNVTNKANSKLPPRNMNWYRKKNPSFTILYLNKITEIGIKPA
jgi:hypothetical protein